MEEDEEEEDEDEDEDEEEAVGGGGERIKGRSRGKQRTLFQKLCFQKQLPGRFELPSTDSESVVIAATLREQGIPHRQIR